MDFSNTTNTTSLQQAPPRDRTSRAESEFSAPEYNITYGQDHTLQWDPPVGSKELALALSYHFPLQADLASKMQAATRRFLRQERDSKKSKSNSPAVDDQVNPRDSSNPSVEEGKDSKVGTTGLQILTWDSGMKQYSHKTKRRRYDKGERVKVAANRGFACDVHRRQKMKCDPEKCSRNKQHVSSLEAIPQSEVNTKPEDTAMTIDGRDPSIHSPESSFQTENTDSTPPQSDGLSLYSITTSDTSQTSPRWSMSSVMNSTNLSFSENPYVNNTFKMTTPSLHPSLHSSLPGSSRAGHDSIGSVLSAYDLEFLANLPDYDVYHPNSDDPNTMWWTQDIPVPQENLLQDGFLPLSFPTNQDQYQSHDQQDQPQEHIDPRIEDNSYIPPPQTFDPTCCCPTLEPQDTEMASTSQPPEPTPETPPDPDLDSDSQTQPPTIPLTTIQKTTLLKWWGRDRLAEPQPPSRPTSSQSLNSHSHSSKTQTTTKNIPSAPSSPTTSQKEKNMNMPSSSSISESHTTSGSGTMRGRRNTLASKVKAVHVQPPFLRRGLWRSSSAGREGK